MPRIPIKSKKTRRWLILGLLVVAVAAVCGCQTLTFYGQALVGQCQILSREQPIQKLINDPGTPARLKERLEIIQDLRAFAANDLKLPVDGHYKKYADLRRPFVVWNVEGAREFSLEPKSWWYPLVGSLEYRGFFSEKRARTYGARLRRNGLDVYVGGVEAYSTLGWFKDPVLNTFVFHRDADLAEIIFHELGHQRVFARGDEDFNEAFATTVGQQGAQRWLKAHGQTEALGRYLAELKRNDQFVHLIMKVRAQLISLYQDQRTEEGKLKSTHREQFLPADELRRQKNALFDQLQKDFRVLKESWGGAKDYDDWFGREVNNAQLNSVAAYYDLLPAFERLLELNGGDLDKFYVEAEKLSKQPKKERQQRLRALAQPEKTPSP